MARTVVLTEAATRRFEKAVLDWWIHSGNGGKPGADKIAAALNCDRRTVMRIRNHQPNDRNLLMTLFAKQANQPMSENHLALWRLTACDFADSQIFARAYILVKEAGQQYQGANYEVAEKRGREALALFQQVQSKQDEAGALQLIGRVEIAQGRFDSARECLERACSLHKTERPDYLTASLHELMGTIYLRQGDWERSRENYMANLAVWQEARDFHCMTDAELSLAALEIAAKCAPQARIHLENARKLVEMLKDAPLRAALMLQEARLLLLEGQPEAAEKCASKALDYWTFADHPRWKAFSHLVLAEIAAKQCRAAVAANQAALSLKLYEKAGDQYGATQARQIQAASSSKSGAAILR